MHVSSPHCRKKPSVRRNKATAHIPLECLNFEIFMKEKKQKLIVDLACQVLGN